METLSEEDQARLDMFLDNLSNIDLDKMLEEVEMDQSNKEI